MQVETLPRHARIVIIGGGVIGCSTAYHLVQLGCRDVVLLERKQLTCGTTWHAAGLLTTLRDTENQTKLAKYTQALYRRLADETGQATGLIECGSIQLAKSEEKAHEMRRGCAMARCFGIENHEISPREVKDLWPLAKVDDLVAAFHFPNDGRVNPADVTQALAKGARSGGVRIFEHTAVVGISTRNGAVCAVSTDQGDIETDIVVNCAGIWAREVGQLAGVAVPLQAAEHYYLVSEPVEGVHNKLPILRDPQNSAYIREEAGKIMLGLFEPVAAPWGLHGIPAGFCFDQIHPDWDRMEPYLEKAMQRVPALLDSGIQLFFCGPESFTPDHNFFLGEAPEVTNFFVAAGFNSLGILSAGGAGKMIAHWIEEGHPPMDMWDVDIRRVLPWQNNVRYLGDRIVESLGIGYQDHWPYRQWQTARGVKKSVFHDRLAAAGACFGEAAGWERANWFGVPGTTPRYDYAWGRQNWFTNQSDEHRAVRENVGLFDQSSFSKFLVQGRDAEKVLNRIATNDCTGAVGKIVYTQFLNERGGIEADLTVTRLGEDRYLLVTAAFTHTHVHAWLQRHISADACCVVTDVSDAYAMLNVQGPKSRELLSAVSAADISHEGFPFGTARTIEIGYQQVLAYRITYCGELGWELYVPTSFALSVYDRIVAAGEKFNLRQCGYHTLNSLRIEKAYREWAHDIGSHDTPIDCDLAFTCQWDKPEGFIGREALLRQRKIDPPPRRLVQFLLDAPEPLLYRNEPIYRDGELISYTTSAMYGHTLGGAVALGYVVSVTGVDENFLAASQFEIEIGAERYPATASLRPLYDPDNKRSRS